MPDEPKTDVQNEPANQPEPKAEPQKEPEQQTEPESKKETPEKPDEPQGHPDNSEIIQLREQLIQAEIKNIGLVQALSLGVDAKTAEAVLKLADLSSAKDKNGRINADNVKTAVSKVLEEFPQLKPSEKPNGFIIGGNSDISQKKVSKSRTETAVKKWNRFK